MARTKRNLNSTQREIAVTWRYALYARKSSDEKDSRSIQNQLALLRRQIQTIAAANPSHHYVCGGEFVDEDKTGTDSNRPNFQKLLLKIQNGEINMLLVTDFSRLSRNTSESLMYIQDFFVRHNTRFVSLELVKIDTYFEAEKIDGLEIQMQSMINESHPRDTSIKVRQRFAAKRTDGEFIGAFAPYGYKKRADDFHRFEIDKEAADVVRLIYKWFLEGFSKTGIAKRLNKQGVLTPAAYKRAKGFRFKAPNAFKNNIAPLWGYSSVHTILNNQMYVGDMVQGRYKIKSYRVHEQVHMPKEDWFIKPDMHPPIVTRENFEKVQQLQKKDTRTAPKKNKVHLFSGYLECADCGRAVIRTKAGKYVYYVCSTYKNYSKTACSKHSIRHDKLYGAVLCALQQQISAIDTGKIIAAVNAAPVINIEKQQLETNIYTQQESLKKLKNYSKNLFLSWQDGIIDKEEFLTLHEDFENQKKQIEKTVSSLQKNVKKLCDNSVQTEPFLNYFLKHQNIKEITRELLATCIDKIYIYENSAIEIVFQFSDTIEEAANSFDSYGQSLQ